LRRFPSASGRPRPASCRFRGHAGTRMRNLAAGDATRAAGACRAVNNGSARPRNERSSPHPVGRRDSAGGWRICGRRRRRNAARRQPLPLSSLWLRASRPSPPGCPFLFGTCPSPASGPRSFLLVPLVLTFLSIPSSYLYGLCKTSYLPVLAVCLLPAALDTAGLLASLQCLDGSCKTPTRRWPARAHSCFRPPPPPLFSSPSSFF